MIPFLNMDGGSNTCMLIRERRFERAGRDSSFTGGDLGCDTNSST